MSTVAAPSAPSSIAPLGPFAWIAILLACVAGPLLAFNLTPSATLFNQLIALAGAGCLLICIEEAQPHGRVGPAVWALLILLCAPWVSWVWTGLPLSLVLSATGLIGTALLLLLAAQGLDDSARRTWFAALCWGLLIAGLLSLVVSVLQVFWPQLPDGDIIAHSGIPGRAVGNMRQPNHLASLLMWSCVAAAYLADQGHLKLFGGAKALPVLLFGFVFAVVLSASRTGMLGVAILAVWGALDRKLSRASRLSLLATPLMLGLAWWLMAQWASSGGHAFGAESRLASEGAGSPERMKILSNAWELVKRNPWTGVGWGEFNLAWSMTPFPNRPIAFFDHSHNLLMELSVELGIPACIAIVGLLLWALWGAFRASMMAQGEDAVTGRCAVMLVLVIGLHSLLEYPLWYAYFLVPTALAFGLALAGGNRHAEPAGKMPDLLMVAGALIIVGSAFAVYDYLRVVAIYKPSDKAGPLAERIATGQHSIFFSPQADYAAATSLDTDERALEAARRTAHNLIDVRLMMAWAESLHAVGDDDRARYVVERLKEFRNAQAQEWLAVCDDPKPGEPLPYKCSPPKREYSWREMR